MRAALLALAFWSPRAGSVELPQPPPPVTQALRAFASRPLPACPQGRLIIGSFPLGPGSPYSLVVLNDGMRTIEGALSVLKKRGLVPAALFNGGYFNLENGEVLSYFKSSFFGRELARNSSRGPRACLAYRPDSGRLELLQSTEANYESWRQARAEVYCAGPQLVENGADVAVRQNCREQFAPECRDDRSDPGVNVLTDYPRTASCFTRDGTFKIFSANSPAAKCGLSGPGVARAMLAEGCVQGLNHDGGGSAKLFLADGGAGVWELGAGSDRRRPVPVWIAIVKTRGP